MAIFIKMSARLGWRREEGKGRESDNLKCQFEIRGREVKESFLLYFMDRTTGLVWLGWDKGMGYSMVW